jgi:glycosyltransferase involved in cell wall biosynthesis
LTILGAGPSPNKDDERRRELAALAGELGIGNDVSLPGFVENPLAYMSRAALFALSSIYEGFGMVLVEALACGCPVVSTACPSGPTEILNNGAYGQLAPIGDPEALAEAMHRTLLTPPDKELLRRRAADFSLERVVDLYESLLLG